MVCADVAVHDAVEMSPSASRARSFALLIVEGMDCSRVGCGWLGVLRGLFVILCASQCVTNNFLSRTAEMAGGG
jgi:hypothetical protein